MAVSGTPAGCDVLHWYCAGVHRPDFAGGPENNLLAMGPGGSLPVGAIAIAAEIILISAGPGRSTLSASRWYSLPQRRWWRSRRWFRQESVPPMSAGLVVVALGLGIFSAIIQVTMNWAQRSVSPTRATVIYTGSRSGRGFWTHCRRALTAAGAGRRGVYRCWGAGE